MKIIKAYTDIAGNPCITEEQAKERTLIYLFSKYGKMGGYQSLQELAKNFDKWYKEYQEWLNES